MSDDLQPGEKQTVTTERRISFWGTAPDELLGDDTHIDELTASNVRVEGEKGSEEIVFEVTAETRGVNSSELPHFESQERYEERQEWAEQYNRNPGPPKRVREAISVGVTGIVIAISSFVAVRVMEAADMTINGEAIDPPSAYGLMAAMATLFFALWAIQYLPRMLRGGSGA